MIYEDTQVVRMCDYPPHLPYPSRKQNNEIRRASCICNTLLKAGTTTKIPMAQVARCMKVVWVFRLQYKY